MSADLNLLLMKESHSSWSGMAINPNYRDPLYRGGLQAYTALAWKTTSWQLTNAHELGHNLGAGHNVEARDKGPTRMANEGWYNFGYMIPDSDKRTIMS